MGWGLIRKLTWAHWILLILILWGLLLRFYRLGAQSLWIDESFTINAAMGVLKHGYPLMDSGYTYGSHYFATYLAAGSIALFGLSEWAGRLPFAIMGTASIPVMFLLGNHVWNKRAGLIAAALTTFMPLHVAWSRNARSYSLLFLFVALGLYYVLRHAESPSHRLLVLIIGVVTGAVITNHFGLILAVVVIGFLFFQRKEQLTTQTWALLGILSILLLSYLLFRLRLYNMLTWTSLWGYYARQYWSFLTKDMLYLSALAGFGFIYLIRRNWRTAVLFLALAGGLFYVISFHVMLVHFRYLFTAYPVLIALAAVAIDGLGQDLGRRVKWFGVCFILLAVAMFSMNSVVPQAVHYLEPQTPQPEFKRAYSKVVLEKDDLVISSYPPLSRFYLGKSDYWLPSSLTGMHINSSAPNLHTGEPAVSSAEALGNLTVSHHGWIIVDNLAMRLLPGSVRQVLHNSTEEVYAESRDFFSGVYVYRFPLPAR